MDLGRAELATVVSPEHAPVLAVAADEPTADEPTPFVTHQVCDGNDCWLQKSPLPGNYLTAGNELMLTPSGRYLVGITDLNGVVTFRIHSDANASEPVEWIASPPVNASSPRHLVATMRGMKPFSAPDRDVPDSDREWVIARDSAGRLLRYAPGAATGEHLAVGVSNLGVAAVGESYLVGRKVHNAGEETLYLVHVDGEGREHEEAKPLLRGATFSRIVVTPRDDMVIATSGEDDDAETFVFDVASGQLLDRFAGAAISGRTPGDDLPGLRAVSPDGSALAYRTPGGAIAMRGLDTQASCLVRSATGTSHSLAGFSADGVLYMESNGGAGKSQIYAFDPPTRRLSTLGDAARGMKLVAVPGREVRDDNDLEGGVVAHWALAVHNGRYEAVLEHGQAEALPLDDEVTILPRDDAAVWLLDTSDAADTIGASKRVLRVRRLAPQLGLTDRALRYDPDRPSIPDLVDGESVGRFEFEISKRSSRACVATGTPGGWGWGCGAASSSLLFEMSPGDREQTADPDKPPLEDQVAPDPPPSDDDDDAP